MKAFEVMVLEICFSGIKNLSLQFTLLKTLSAIDSPFRVSSRIQPRYFTLECCFILIPSYSIFIFAVFFNLYLFTKRIDLDLSSPKWILSLFSMNQSQRLAKSSFSFFSISFKSLCWNTRHESSAYKYNSDDTASG